MRSAHDDSGMHDVLAVPTEADIREQFDRIRTSPEFQAPGRGRSFLAYVIEETLAGRGNQLKAYSIAIEVFGRDSSFDAQSDPVVRIEAGRIRRALERYYLVAGRSDPIVITIPKGGYVPLFAHVVPEASPPASTPAAKNSPRQPQGDRSVAFERWLWLAMATMALIALVLTIFSVQRVRPIEHLAEPPLRTEGNFVDVPKIVIQPFQDLSGSADSAAIARGLTDEVIGQLSKFKEIVVIAGELNPDRSSTSADQNGGWRYSLEGRVRLDGSRLRLNIRFLSRADGSVIWANGYDRDLHVQDRLDVEADIAKGVATALAQPYGIIFQTDAARMAASAPDNRGAYACTLAYYGYRSSLNVQSHASIRDCLERATQQFPQSSTLWALLSLTYLDELRFRYGSDVPPAKSLELAQETAERAVELDRQNVRALQAQMLASFFHGQIEAALKIGADAIAINPNDTELAAEYGFRLALSGQWTPGCALISGALAQNPVPKGYFEVALALCAYMKNDSAAAEQWAKTTGLEGNPIQHLVLLAILGAGGKLEEAGKERQWLAANAPQMLKDIRGEVAMRIFRPEDQEHILNGLKAAGLTIPPR